MRGFGTREQMQPEIEKLQPEILHATQDFKKEKKKTAGTRQQRAQRTKLYVYKSRTYHTVSTLLILSEGIRFTVFLRIPLSVLEIYLRLQ